MEEIIVFEIFLSYLLPSQGNSYNRGYPSETYLKFKFREVAYAHNTPFISQTGLYIFNDCGIDMLCAKYKNELTATKYMDTRHVVRFQFQKHSMRNHILRQPLSIRKWYEI